MSAVTREIKPGDTRILFKGTIPLIELMILVLTTYWLISFFDPAIIPGIPHTGGFIYMLAVGIVILILLKFLSEDRVPTLLSFSR